MLYSETFWVAVAFVLFVFLVSKPLAKILGKALDDRADKIQKELDQALKLKEEAQALLSSYQRKHKEVLEEAKHIITKAEKEAKSYLEESEKELEASLNKRIQMAMEKISAYEASVIQEVREQAVDIAVEAVKKVTSDLLNKKSQDDLINQAIKEVNTKF